MTLSAEELFQAGLHLRPSLRKEPALRLLESVEVVDESIDQEWADAVASWIDDIRGGKVQTIPGDLVLARLAEHRAVRQTARE